MTEGQYWKNGEIISSILQSFNVNVNISENVHRLILNGNDDINDIKEVCKILQSNGLIYSDFGNKTDIDKIIFDDKIDKLIKTDNWYFNIDVSYDTITINISKNKNQLKKNIDDGINVVDDYDNHRGYLDNINKIFVEPWSKLIDIFYEEDLGDIGEESSGNFGTWEFEGIDEDIIDNILKKMKKSLISEGFIEI